MQWRPSLLLVAVAALSVAQDGSMIMTPAVQRVGMKLACLCGTCKNTVGDCPMLMCHYSMPAREKIAKLQEASMSDAQIIQTVVKEQGIQALASPPTQGFSLLAWVMPFVAIALGLLFLSWYVKRQRRPASAPELDPVLLERYRSQIEKDTAKLDQ